jgi:hypothetical protein
MVMKELLYSKEQLIDFARFYFTEEFNSSMQDSKSTEEIFNLWESQFKKPSNITQDNIDEELAKYL